MNWDDLYKYIIHIHQAAGERLGERLEYSEIHSEVVSDH